MSEILIIVIVGISSLFIGGLVASTFLRKAIERKSETILKEAQEKAEVIKKDKILQAKEKFLQLKAEHEKIINERSSEVQKSENRLKQREVNFSQKLEESQRKQKEVDTIKENLTNQLELLNKKQVDIEKLHKQQVEQLETISDLSASEAKNQLIETLKEEAKSEAQVFIRDIVEEAKMSAHGEAKKIVIETIQRTATEHAIENTVS
ncbi:MAG: Rnase Y domain-containing protein, partial [Bacteroidota bacterium]|nr:Rnase Y domain-containing protein [Bacteroidota bacterium]